MKYLLSFVLSMASLFAADVTGTWTGTLTRTSEGGGQPSPAHLILKQEGITLTGSGGPNACEQSASWK